MSFRRLVLSCLAVLFAASPAFARDAPAWLTVTPSATSGALPPAVTVSWFSTCGHVDLTVRNDGHDPVELVWDSSAYANSTGASVGVVPGSSLKRDVKAATPVSVVVPGAFLKEPVVREDALDLGNPEDVWPLVTEADLYGQVRILLTFRQGEATTSFTQTFDVKAVNLSTGKAISLTSLKYRGRATRWQHAAIWTWVGGALLSFGVIGAISDDPNPTGEQLGMDITLGTIAVASVPMGVVFQRKANAARKKAKKW